MAVSKVHIAKMLGFLYPLLRLFNTLTCCTHNLWKCYHMVQMHVLI